MTDKKEPDSALEIYPGDVSITDQGAVEIINARLAEVVKNAVSMEKEFGRPARLAAEDSNTGCGNNVYQCGKATALTDRPVKLRLS